ncbi:MAG: hypothetical protein LAT56_17775, partial [Wenzhouxiangella sp.]|nr:hypothetical protein [Wenzhouxiangella sp.]
GGRGISFDLLIDDLIVPFRLPETPVIQWTVEGAGRHTEDQISNENFSGVAPGRMFVKYAFRLSDGTLAKHSEPQQISLPRYINGGDEILTYRLIFHNDGYRQLSSPFGDPILDFWSDEITGVAVLLGGYKRDSEFVNPSRVPIETIDDILFYEVASFSSINPESREMDDRVAIYDDSGENISTYRLANVDNNSHHSIFPGVITSYNSRLIAGNIKTAFANPTTRVNRYVETAIYLNKSNDTVRINFVGAHGPDDYDIEVTNLENQETRSVNLTDKNPNGKNAAADFLLSSGTWLFKNEWRADIINPSTSYSVTFTPKEESQSVAQYPVHSFTVTSIYWDNPSITYRMLPVGEFVLQDPVQIRIGVDLDTQSGDFQRVSSSDITVSKKNTPGFDQFYFMQFSGLISYPDRRAKKMYIWEKVGQQYNLVSKFDLKQPVTQNFAYRASNLPVTEDNDSLFASSVNDISDYAPNKIQASETNAPFSFLSDKVYFVGKASSNAITGFASNTFAVSEGQFGQFPLYVFCEDSIWALEQSRDPLVAFGSNPPVSLSHGAAKWTDIINIGRSIAFRYKDGLFFMSGSQVDEFSKPINTYPNRPQIDWDSIVMASRKRAGTDELLLCDQKNTYVFNLEYGRWYEIHRLRKWWFTVGGSLYGIDGTGDIYDEFATNDNPVPYRIYMNPIHFGEAELLKRVKRVVLRGKTRVRTMGVKSGNGWFEGRDSILYMKGQSGYEFQLSIDGTMDSDNQYLEAISAEVEARYPHKNRVHT